MSDRVRVVGRGGAGAAPDRRPIWWAIALVAVAAAFLIGRLTGDDGGSAPPQASAGPANVEAGVPVGYAHSEAGAVAAALNYGAVAARDDFLTAERRKRVLDLVATPGFAMRFESKAAPAYRLALQGPLGQGLRTGAPTVSLSAPLAYKVVSYTPSRAVIAGWGVAVSGNTAGFKPQIDFQTTRSVLVWRDGDWKLDGGESTPGPAPELAESVQPSSAQKFVDELDAMQSVQYAP